MGAKIDFTRRVNFSCARSNRAVARCDVLVDCSSSLLAGSEAAKLTLRVKLILAAPDPTTCMNRDRSSKNKQIYCTIS